MGKGFSVRQKRRRIDTAICKDFEKVLKEFEERNIGMVESVSQVSEDQVAAENNRNNCGSINSITCSESDCEPDSTVVEQADIQSFRSGDSASISTAEDDDDDSQILQLKVDVPIKVDVPEQIRTWALENNVTHRAIDQLLKILNPHHKSLPLCARTLLETPRSFSIEEVSGGKYIHVGLRRNLETRLKDAQRSLGIRKIDLSFNIDGLPVHNNSNNNSLWPVLGLIRSENDSRPFCIGLYLGQSKPNSVRSYLEPFVKELKEISEMPFHVNGQEFQVDIKKCLFICDTPARAFLKGILGHNATYGCDKCTVKGTWLSQYRKTVFLSTTSPMRTNESFRLRQQDGHHQNEFQDCASLLGWLDIDMVKQFPSDYMHLICLGNVRKLCWLWKKGRKSVRLGSHQMQEISDLIHEAVKLLPTEFSRKTRSILHSERWKATECRLFVLYLGPIILKTVLPDALYKHFLLLASSMLLVTSEDSKNDHSAGEYLRIFVEHFPKLYGDECLTYNAHNVLHLITDVQEHGAVDSFSCFPFENHLAAIKRLVRAPNHTLQQVYARLMELEHVQRPSVKNKNLKLTCEHRNGPLFHFDGDKPKQFSSIELPGFKLCLNDKDCYFYGNNKFVKLKNVVEQDGEIILLGQPLKMSGDVFDYPCKSSHVGICFVTEDYLELETFNPHLVIKCFMVVVRNKSVCVKLRHLS